jgi:hypothetical protein
MGDLSSSGLSNPFNSSRSRSSNPFAGPSVAVIRDVPVLERVPIKLSHTAGPIAAGRLVSEVTHGASPDDPKSPETKKLAGPGT